MTNDDDDDGVLHFLFIFIAFFLVNSEWGFFELRILPGHRGKPT